MNEGNFHLDDYLIKQVLNLAHSQDIVPTIDAFASKHNKVFPLYWSRHSDAFNKDWSNQVLWINPPHNLYERIVEKILLDEAIGIIFVPIRYSELWFIALSRITTFWWDIDNRNPILLNDEGNNVSKGIRIRVIFFNAFQALKRRNTSSINLCSLKNEQSQTSAIKYTIAEGDYDSYIQRIEKTNNIYTSVFGHDERSISSVIESTACASGSEKYISDLKKKFDNVMNNPLYTKDIDPTSRGPFGVAKIELKEGSIPTRNVSLEVMVKEKKL